MQDTTIAKSFKFDEKGTTKNATFTGPVIAFDDGFLLVPKKMQSQFGTTMAVNFGSLDDGTVYPSNSVLNGEGKGLRISIENSGYRKTTP